MRPLRYVLRLARDAFDAARTLREVEKARWVEGPATLVPRLRARGLEASPRTDGERRQLLRVIHHVDRVFPGGSNCYRRSLARLALDPASAGEPFVLGLNRDGEARGHAWVEGADATGERFDVEFRL